MSARILDGRAVADRIISKLKNTLHHHRMAGGQQPGLAVILIGHDPASQIYVRHKRNACEQAGIASFAFDFPEGLSENEMLDLIDSLNHRSDIHGILVQLPLPDGIDSFKIIEKLDPSKDVDGFHPFNLGRLAQRNPALRPCTPYGIIQLLEAYDISLRSKHAVVLGASNIVGRPMALECLQSGATVTICHKSTPHLEPHIRLADVIISATGVPDLINPEWLNKNQIIIDVGMHRLPNGRLRGDVNFDIAKEKVGAITPVPGGVGPMTVVTLLQNTLQAAGIHPIS